MNTRRATQTSPAAAPGSQCDFLLSGFSEEEKQDLAAKIAKLGGKYHDVREYIPRCTHIICVKLMRSEKFLCGCSAGKWILKPEFIHASARLGRWQMETEFEWGYNPMETPDLPTGFQSAPRRWRRRVAETGKGAFHDWKVLLVVENVKRRPAVYKRVIESGGGQCLPFKLPLKDPEALAAQLTHVLVDKCYMEEVRCLEKRGVPCLPPDYIADYLFETKVDDTTPPTTVKEDTRPAATDAARGVKRKLQFTPNQLQEALNIRKARKLSRLHLPLVPYTMMIPRSKKTFQHEDCPSRPFPRKLTHVLDGLVEENQWLEELSLIQSSVSTHCYPPPEVLHHIMKQVLQSQSLTVSRSATHTLKLVLCLHSPAQHPALRKVYLRAMAPPNNAGKMTYHSEHWSFLEAVIRRALDGQSINKDAAEEHKDEASVMVAMETAEMLLQFLVALMEEDFAAAFRSYDCESEFSNDKGPAHCILAQVLWPGSLERSSRRVPVNIQQLLVCFVDAIKLAAKCDDWIPVTNLVSTLVQVAAESSSVMAEQSSTKNAQKNRCDAQQKFAQALASLAKENGLLATRPLLETFLSMIRPSWLRQGVAEALLQGYDDQLLGEDASFWADQSLSLRKLVRYYFYLLPPLSQSEKSDSSESDSAKSEHKTEPKSTPLKVLSNKNNNKEKLPTGLKSGVSVKPVTKKKVLNVNRKNIRGETPLHQACIKNDLARVRELLTSPNININAKDNAGWTPLHEACNFGHIACVQELLKYKPGKQLLSGSSPLTLDFLATPPCGTTALHDAVTNHHIDVVRVLVAAGGKSLLAAKNSDGQTAEDLAVTDVLKEALQLGSGTPAMTPRNHGGGKENGLIQPNEKGESVAQYPPESPLVCFRTPSLRADKQTPQPSTSRYHQIFGPSQTPKAFVSEENCEKYAILVMALLQSYVRAGDLHRVKAEVDVIKMEQKVANRKQIRGITHQDNRSRVTTLLSPTTVSQSGTSSPHDPSHPDSNLDSLLDDLEVFTELGRHVEGFKTHLRQIGLFADPSKNVVCKRVSRDMRLLVQLGAAMC